MGIFKEEDKFIPHVIKTLTQRRRFPIDGRCILIIRLDCVLLFDVSGWTGLLDDSLIGFLSSCPFVDRGGKSHHEWNWRPGVKWGVSLVSSNYLGEKERPVRCETNDRSKISRRDVVVDEVFHEGEIFGCRSPFQCCPVSSSVSCYICICAVSLFLTLCLHRNRSVCRGEDRELSRRVQVVFLFFFSNRETFCERKVDRYMNS